MTAAHTKHPKLRVKGATKVYHTRSGDLLAIDRCSLDIMEGEFVSIVGPSGCGKTTLLWSMSGLHGLTAGEVLLDGKPVTGPNPEIGMVFQEANLLPWRNLEANINFPFEIKGTKPDRVWIDELLNRVGLEGFGGRFSLAFRKGRGTNDLKTLEGKTILLGSAAWQSIVDPMLGVQGVDITKVKYVEAGWPTWATALKAGQGDAALSWEELRAEWIGSGLDFEYWLGVQRSPLFANTFVGRAADLDDPDKKAFLDKYLRGWAMGLEFAYHNPRAAVEAVFEQFPTLASNIGPELGTTSILQQIAVFRSDMDKRKGWGDHDMAAWQTFFDKIYELKQVSKPIKAEDVCSNDCIGPANDFDHAKVKADADAYKLSDAFAAIDVDNVKAHLYDQAVPG
jgi:ABC-type sugar transport system ATPase subunit